MGWKRALGGILVGCHSRWYVNALKKRIYLVAPLVCGGYDDDAEERRTYMPYKGNVLQVSQGKEDGQDPPNGPWLPSPHGLQPSRKSVLQRGDHTRGGRHVCDVENGSRNDAGNRNRNEKQQEPEGRVGVPRHGDGGEIT